MTITEVVIKMADIFEEEYIRGDGFNNFKHMARCYGYEPSDIKEEVIANLREYLDDDGDFNVEGEEIVSYRNFIRKVYSELDKRGIYD